MSNLRGTSQAREGYRKISAGGGSGKRNALLMGAFRTKRERSNKMDGFEEISADNTALYRAGETSA